MYAQINGDVVRAFSVSTGLNPALTQVATGTSSACITATADGALTPAELAGIVADPGAYYVNVHTKVYPGGEIRGQLK